MNKRILVIAIAFALCGCFRWDMDAFGWSKATEMCAPHGGILAADEHAMQSGHIRVDALCKSGARVTETFPRPKD